MYVTKSGSSRYMSAVSNTLLITVKESAQSALQQNSPRNWLIYAEQNQKYLVLVNLASRYANSDAEIQLRTYVAGRIVYQKLGNVTLDSRGDAVLDVANRLLKGSRLRLVIDGSNIKFGTSI